MMKYTPRVRSDIAPITSAASAATPMAAGHASHALRKPSTARRTTPEAPAPKTGAGADHESAGAEEGGVSEGDHAAIAEDQVEAGGGDGIDQDAAGEGHVEHAV